jgi:hypothetical protein
MQKIILRNKDGAEVEFEPNTMWMLIIECKNNNPKN